MSVQIERAVKVMQQGGSREATEPLEYLTEDKFDASDI